MLTDAELSINWRGRCNELAGDKQKLIERCQQLEKALSNANLLIGDGAAEATKAIKQLEAERDRLMKVVIAAKAWNEHATGLVFMVIGLVALLFIAWKS